MNTGKENWSNLFFYSKAHYIIVEQPNRWWLLKVTDLLIVFDAIPNSHAQKKILTLIENFSIFLQPLQYNDPKINIT